MTPDPDGLRERKKAKTKATIQAEALRLFRTQGYAATSIEQIAAAAEVSHRTVFRYFATKEDLVSADGYDTLIASAYRAQPPNLNAVEAFRRAFAEVFGTLNSPAVEEAKQRQLLALTVPEVWAAGLQNIVRVRSLILELTAERIGDEPEARTVGGLVFGALLAAWFAWADDPALDVVAALDAGLARLDH
ncbi:TetR/AcrR family transcriptional regulator [Flindersiella endophytica]